MQLNCLYSLPFPLLSHSHSSPLVTFLFFSVSFTHFYFNGICLIYYLLFIIFSNVSSWIVWIRSLFRYSHSHSSPLGAFLFFLGFFYTFFICLLPFMPFQLLLTSHFNWYSHFPHLLNFLFVSSFHSFIFHYRFLSFIHFFRSFPSF